MEGALARTDLVWVRYPLRNREGKKPRTSAPHLNVLISLARADTSQIGPNRSDDRRGLTPKAYFGALIAVRPVKPAAGGEDEIE